MTRHILSNLFVSAAVALAALMLVVGVVGAKPSAPLLTEPPISNSASNRATTSTLALPRVITTVQLEFSPSLVRVNPATGYAYVEGTQDHKTYEMVILSQTQIVSRFTVYDLPNFEPGDCVYINIDPDTGYTYIATCHSNDVIVLLGTRVIESIPLEESPFKIFVNPRTRSVSDLIYAKNRLHWIV